MTGEEGNEKKRGNRWLRQGGREGGRKVRRSRESPCMDAKSERERDSERTRERESERERQRDREREGTHTYT